jgi:hypothetical protein
MRADAVALTPQEQVWEWQMLARCRDVDPGIFFAVEGPWVQRLP